ncbi:MAG: 3-dehydroquinate synthase [Propionibacteriaceae bacterium]
MRHVTQRVHVSAERPYDVVIGSGLQEQVLELVGRADRVALVCSTAMGELAAGYREALEATGTTAHVLTVPDAEQAKTADVLTRCWDALGEWRFTRSDVVLGVGGGAVTDLAGFVAATWLRGVRLVSVPTTLLGMVDAAVGGKTGINTAAGKNLVGAFYEPAGVVCDLDRLVTLPRADLRAGLAEVVKCGFIADPEILAELEPYSSSGTLPDPTDPVLAELVQRAVAVKAAVVSADLREATSSGTTVGRELLNYGHTLAHAVERREAYRWRHGDAVSVGLVFAAELARHTGLLADEVADRHAQVLAGLGLPVRYDPDAFDELVTAMGMDKKARGSTLRFIVLEGLGRARVLAGPAPDLLRTAYGAMHP